MPICPNCGREFEKGGAYTTHVQSCTSNDQTQAETSENKSLRERVREQAKRLARVEEETAKVPTQSRVRAAENTAHDARQKAEKALKETREEREKRREKAVSASCSDCGREVAHPQLRPPECPACGAELRWDDLAQQLEDAAHQQEQNGGETTKETADTEPAKTKTTATE